MMIAPVSSLSVAAVHGTDVDQDRTGCQLIIEAPGFHPVSTARPASSASIADWDTMHISSTSADGDAGEGLNPTAWSGVGLAIPSIICHRRERDLEIGGIVTGDGEAGALRGRPTRRLQIANARRDRSPASKVCRYASRSCSVTMKESPGQAANAAVAASVRTAEQPLHLAAAPSC
jgi:hypothetical protein